MATRSTSLPLTLLSLFAVPAVWAQSPPSGLEAWWPPLPRRTLPPPAQPDPASLDVIPLDAAYRGLLALGQAGEDAEVVAALRERMLRPGLRQKLVLSPDMLVGAQEHARRRLLALVARGAPYPALAEVEAAEYQARARHGGAAALWRTLDQFPASRAATGAALRLSESLAEDGRLAEAVFVLRQTSETPRVTSRLRHLRSLPTEGTPWRGQRGLTPRTPIPRLLWARRAPSQLGTSRPLAADRDRVYLLDRLGLAAVSRASGILLWRSPRQRGPRGDPRLALGHGLLLHLTRRHVRALSVGDGEPSWDLPLERKDGAELTARDRFHAVVATPQGFLLLATQAEVRRLIALTPSGQVRWRTRLWSAPSETHDYRYALHLRARKPGESPTPESPGFHVQPEPLRGPVTASDGQLGALADAVLLTLDGLLAAVGDARGELRWVRARTLSRAAAGSRHWVQLSVWPYQANAVLRGGLLVSVDPRTGRRLPAAEPPPGDPADLAEAYPLANSHAVIGWRWASEPGRVQITQQGRAVTSLPCDRVSGPGAVWGGLLAIPGRDALSLVDLGSGELRSLGWTDPVGPCWPSTHDGLLLVSSPSGVAAYGLADPAPSPPASLRNAPPPRLLEALSHGSWLRRWEAQQALRELGAESLSGLEPETLEAAEILTEIRAQAERDARWRRLAPSLSEARRSALWELPTAQALEQALKKLPAGDHERDLRAELAALAEEDLELAWPLAWTLLQRYPLDQGLLVLEIRQATEAGVAVVAANMLVELADQSGNLEPLRRAIQHPDPTTRALVTIQISANEGLRKQLFGDEEAWGERLQADWRALAQRWGGIQPPSVQQGTELRARIVRALLEE